MGTRLGFGLSTTSLRRGLALAALFGAADTGSALDLSRLDALYQDSAGATPATAPDQTVGLKLDQSKGLVLGSELLGGGVPTLLGTATVASYDTETGAGSMTRVDAANQSYIKWTGLADSLHKITVQNTGSISLFVRTGDLGTIIFSVDAGATVTGYVSPTSGIITVAAGTGTATFTVSSFKTLPGRHATQATALQRMKLGRAPVSRRNKLIETENLAASAWIKRGTTTVSGQRISGIGAAGTDDIYTTAGNAVMFPASAGITTSLKFRRVSTSGSLRVDHPAGAGNYGYWTVNLGLLSDDWEVLTKDHPAVNEVIPLVSTASGGGGLHFHAGSGAPLSFDLAWSQQELGSTATPYQKVGASNLDIIEPHPDAPARRNLLTHTEDISNSVYVKTECSVAPTSIADPDGRLLQRLIPSVNAVAHYAQYALSPANAALLSGVGTSVQIVAKKEGAIDKITIYPGASNTFAHFDLTAGTTTRESNVTSSTLELQSDGSYLLTVVWPGSVATDRLRVYASSGSIGAAATAGDGVSGVLIGAPQLEPGLTATTYEPVGAFWDPVQSVPSYWFLRPDYSDDNLVVNLPALPVPENNKLRFTEQFGNAYWSHTSTTVKENTHVSPDGLTTADTFTFTDGVNSFVHKGSISLPAGVAHTFSVWLKGTAGQTLRIYMDTAGTGTYTYAGTNVTLTGDWQRETVTWTGAADNTAANAVINKTGGQTALVVQAWGAQLKEGTTAGEYERHGDHQGTLILAGRDGTFVETILRGAGDYAVSSVSTNASGTSITNILRAVGDLVCVFFISRVLSAAEEARVISYYRARGAGGKLSEGPELVVNGDMSSATGWTLIQPTSGSTTISGGKLDINSLDGSGTYARQTILTVGSTYVARVEADSLKAGGMSIQLGNWERSLNVGTFSVAHLVGGDGNALLKRFQSSTTPSGGVADNLSIKQLIPEAA